MAVFISNGDTKSITDNIVHVKSNGSSINLGEFLRNSVVITNTGANTKTPMIAWGRISSQIPAKGKVITHTVPFPSGFETISDPVVLTTFGGGIHGLVN